jgi:S-adenosylmethionine/arginine decarboxylase-like enzyme
MCGNAEPRKALAALEQAFTPNRVVVGMHKRGVSIKAVMTAPIAAASFDHLPMNI